MRTETIQKTYLEFNELNESQKKKAIEKNRDFNTDHEWWDHVYEDAKTIASMLGLEISNIYFRGFSSQGDGACFECHFSHEKEMVKKVSGYAPNDTELHRIAKEMQSLYAKSFYTARGSSVQSGHYNHEYSMRIDIDHAKGACDYTEWREIFASFAKWIYSQLKSEYDYLTSDKTIAEMLIINKIEFDTDLF